MYQSSEPIVALLFSCSGPTLPLSGVLGKVGQVTPSAVMVAVPPSAVGPNSPLLTTRTPPQRVSLRGGDVTSPFPSPGLLPGLFPQRLESAVDSLVNYLPTWQALPAGKWALGTIRSGFRLLWGHRRTPPFFLGPPSFRPLVSADWAAVLREVVAALVM